MKSRFSLSTRSEFVGSGFFSSLIDVSASNRDVLKVFPCQKNEKTFFYFFTLSRSRESV